MNAAVAATLIGLSAANLATTVLMARAMLKAKAEVDQQVEDVKEKTNDTLKTLGTAILNIKV